MNAINMNSCSEHQPNNEDQYIIPSKFLAEMKLNKLCRPPGKQSLGWENLVSYFNTYFNITYRYKFTLRKL